MNYLKSHFPLTRNETMKIFSKKWFPYFFTQKKAFPKISHNFLFEKDALERDL